MTGICGWLVLPDRDVAPGLRGVAPTALSHPSGRPWVLGRLPADGPDVTVTAAAGRVRLAVLGATTITSDELARWAEKIESPSGLDALATVLHGCAHLLASVDGVVRVQGSVSGVRAVNHTVVDGVTVASDRGDLPARLAGAAVDETELAVRLLPIGPSALTRSVWRGVETLPSDAWLEIGTDGRARTVPWWTPPEPHLTLGEGAARLREALGQAVRARADRAVHVGADLSGGLDSTPLCFLAADAVGPAGGTLTTVRIGVADPAHDDHVWAGRAERELAGDHLRHHVLDGTAAPAMFAGVAEPVPGLEEPMRWIRTIGRLRHIAGWFDGHGARVHLTGHGGDEVLVAKPPYLHDLFGRNPVLARRHFTAWRAMKRWSLAAGVRELADRRSFRSWLRRESGRLTEEFPPTRMPQLGWGYPARMPPWATGDAVATVAERFAAAAGTVHPAAPDRASHLAVDLVRQAGAAVRQAQQVTGTAGTVLHAPYLDDRVVEACLAVIPEERSSPWRYKPLMAEAMAGRMPAESLRRGTKGEFSDDLHRGMHQHRDQLAALFDDPLIGRMGLIDTGTLRRAALSVLPAGVPAAGIDTAMAVENWLRAAGAHA